ncbi:ras guanine nucleotide exchange factor domain-containing protein [Suillus clintonianus]|uniref:ras guanine nucleotide exchange factor domain-containing protein n=1 Tax=Suillus clintonianus TaxID=1904413 RepID=UPI001B87F169|nr:ras guanine nucleotide exchange factor domain-containing protein [Suillus clintonianus]KAG2145892.1 ras guanine nucleotide exchange factor domain-containing protein [Suillus clintonianus]
MAAIGLAMYSGVNSYPSQSTTITVEQEQQISQLPEEQYISTFFCRALYDYQTQDASSLSFHKNEIIEVLTQLESGWWDGLLGDERGWFPSNYVVVISDEEAEIVLSNNGATTQQGPLQQVHETTHDVHSNDFHSRAQDHRLSDSELPRNKHDLSVPSNGLLESRSAAEHSATLSSDFWMPQVTQDGQIYYVNTHTGQISRDLPIEGDDVSAGELAGLASSPPSSRSGTSAGLGLSALTEPSVLGFGVQKRSGTPEPWVRRLADDGMSYYYWNKLTGQVSWTIPDAEAAAQKGRSRALTSSSTSSELFNSPDEDSVPTRFRSDSTTSQTPHDKSHSKPEHVSDSEDSCLYSPDHGDSPSTSGRSQSGQDLFADELALRKPSVELTAAEKIAQSLQQSLAPPPPDLISDISHVAHNAISAVVQKNQSLVGVSRRAEHGQVLDSLIRAVVITVRNLLYISAPPGHIPSNLIPRDARGRRETTASQTLLKPAQRKVTATLSKLVLSARAMEYDSGPAAHETASRVESDAAELDRAIVAFVVEVQRCQNEQLGGVGAKRIQGCFSAVYLGLGLVGAGYAGTWRGFGWVPLDDNDEAPQRILDGDVFSEFKTHMVSMQARFGTFNTALKTIGDDSQQRVWIAGRELLSGLSSLLLFVANIHIARHVDIDGFYSNIADAERAALYTQTVDKARLLTRTLEAVVQALYDDAATLLLSMQRVRRLTYRTSRQDRDLQCEYLDAISVSLKSNLQFLMQTLDTLLSLGHDQADMAQGEYSGAIEWRMSRLSIIDSNFDARPMSVLDPADPESEDIVDIEVAFGASGMKKSAAILGDRAPAFRSQSQLSDTTITLTDRSLRTVASNYDPTTSVHTLVPSTFERPQDVLSMSDSASVLDDDSATTRTATKIKKIFGDDAPEHIISTKPWYLRPDYTKNDMIIDVDGSVRAGTVPALVERLTSHDPSDPTFIKTFLMTYKSFTTLDDFFDHLVRRFRIQTPEGLSPAESEEWRKLKQHIIQMRVLNTLKAMVSDEDFLEKEDTYILNRMKEFLQNEDVSKIFAAKQLLSLVDRARGGEVKKGLTPTMGSPPPSILPKPNKKLKLLDIDSLELARQLTIMESYLYQKIRPVECLQRSREQKTDHNDNIARVIQTSNRIANWVADSVLMHEDSRKRSAILKQFISVADRCRSMHNYSSMVAIVSGLNSPPIRRLKRSWEQVNARHMAQLGTCEMTIDSGKNFNNYRSTLARVSPPCVPFIGVFLTTLTFIQDGSKDTLPGNLVNFRKRQKASEVIQDIQRWQTFPHNFNPITSVQTYIEESLAKFSEQVDVGDYFWNLSLEREPREREDEKMARLLQESGFL